MRVDDVPAGSVAKHRHPVAKAEKAGWALDADSERWTARRWRGEEPVVLCRVTFITAQRECFELSGTVDTHNRGVCVHGGVCVSQESRKTDLVTLTFALIVSKLGYYCWS